MMRATVPFIMLVAFSVAVAVSPVVGADLNFAEGWTNLTPEHKRFLEQLSEKFKRENPDLAPTWVVDRFHAAAFDLNGDGVAELLVRPSSGVLCGNSGDCFASIYQKRTPGWIFVGWVIDTNSVVAVENLWVNGWRTLSDGVESHPPTSRWCWMNQTSAGPEDAWIYEDPLGMPSTPGMAGYFGTKLPADADCPLDMIPTPSSK